MIHDPRPSNPTNAVFTVEYLGNMVGGKDVTYINEPIEILMKYTAESIKNNDPVWFGCEVSKRFASKSGLEDLTM